MTPTKIITLLLSLCWLATASGQQPTVAASVVSPDYIISPGDVVTLFTLNDPDGDATARVTNKGYVKHPYLGFVKVAGLTESSAAKVLEQALRGDYLVNPQVRVTVVNYAKVSFDVVGAVRSPGNFEVPANKRVTIVSAIARAGDFKDVAKKDAVILHRMENGQVRPYKVNVEALLKDPSKGPIYIQDGDTIEVKEGLW